MTSHYLSHEASVARVQALCLRTIEDYRAGRVDPWTLPPSVREAVFFGLAAGPDSVAFAECVERAAA